MLQDTTGEQGQTLPSALEHLDCADYVATVITHTRRIQEKTNRLHSFGQQVGLAINCDKSRIVYVENGVAEPVRLWEHTLEFVATFTYPGSTIFLWKRQK